MFASHLSSPLRSKAFVLLHVLPAVVVVGDPNLTREGFTSFLVASQASFQSTSASRTTHFIKLKKATKSTRKPTVVSTFLDSKT